MLRMILDPMNVLTIVSADVEQDRADDLATEFKKLLAGGLPQGLLQTRLVGDGLGHWAIHSLWRDRAALDAMRTSAEPPAAPALFRRFVAEPTLVVMEVLVDSADRR
jgi:quinol monooxygenase YgiN